MLIFNRIENSRANGPGNRAVIWTQGCTLACPGCWNPETHVFDTTKQICTETLVEWVLNLPDIEGVTFSGGEPFQQAAELYRFCKMMKDRRPEFSVAAYTGYTLKELQNWVVTITRGMPSSQMVSNNVWYVEQALSRMDFIVAGRYNHTLRCSDKPLCGSRNQEVIFLTDRYSAEDLGPNVVEILIDPAASAVQMTGFPDDPNLLE